LQDYPVKAFQQQYNWFLYYSKSIKECYFSIDKPKSNEWNPGGVMLVVPCRNFEW
jgi:hypothetical protein